MGKQIFCLSGDTEIVHSKNTCHTLSELEDQHVDVLQYDHVNDEVYKGYGYCKCTGYTKSMIRLTMEDGSILEGTPDHLVLLSDGSYKRLGDLTENDDILELPFMQAEVD